MTRSARAGAIVFLAAFATSSRVDARDPIGSDATTFGLEGSFTRTRGGDRDGRSATQPGQHLNAETGSLTLSGSRIGYAYDDGLAVRVVNTFSLGGSADGLEGGLGMAIAGGWRAPFARTHGLVVRGGAEASLWGNKVLYDSLLELPQVHAGYQWLTKSALAEIAMKGGSVLLGRHDTGDAAHRELDGAFEWGAFTALRVRPVDLRASFTRVFARHGGTPVNLFAAELCARSLFLVLCTDARYERGDVDASAGELRDARATYVGFLVGFEAGPSKAPRDKPGP